MKRVLLTLTLVFFIAPIVKAQGEQRYADGTATDQDGNTFEWINYGTQDWSIENAEVVTYRDGTEIPQVTDATEWSNLTTGAWCYYNNDQSKGKLYNWYAVMGIHDNDDNTPNKEFAPEGWRVPSDNEWTELENYLIDNGYNYDGTTTGNKIAISMASTTEWNSSTNVGMPGYDQGINNTSGFNAVAKGVRNFEGDFRLEGNNAIFRSSTEEDSQTAWNRNLLYNFSYLYRNNGFKQGGISVRFVRDLSEGDILLNGTVSVENNQIKNVANPTDAQDAVTKAYVDALSNPQGSVPVVGSSVVSDISFSTATVKSSLSDTGNQIVLSKGFYIDTISPPSATNSQGIAPNNQEIGDYTIGLSNLLPNTTYYVRGYATTIIGTGLGDVVSFTTSSNLTIPELTTTAASEITFTSAKVGGAIISDGGSTIINRGICWSSSSNPTLSDSSFESGTGLGSFSLSISSLEPDTIYYVRSYATNSFGTNYGNQIQFRTLSYNLPTLSTLSPNGLTTTSVNSGGNIVNDGGAAIISKGVCWATTSDPTIANNKTEDGSGSGLFNSFIDGLSINNTYYIRAYATNVVGTSYGNQQTIVNNAVLPPNPTIPIVGTSSSNNILTATTASSGGYVSQNGGSDLTAKGVCWSLSENPTIADSHTNDGSGLGFFTSTLTGLSGCGTVYYVRAYATNENGTGYGAQYTVTTGLLPTISTNSATAITENSFTSGGTIISDGGCPITAKGICWSISPNPTTDNEVTNEGGSIDDFSSSATNLLSNLAYYVRAYVTNSVGTTYGEEIVINTGIPGGLYIGQSYAGGIIFYLDDTGEHGLVSADIDQQNINDGVNQNNQCPIGTTFETDTIIGSGAQNTTNIISACNTTSNVAYICDNLVLNGYDDWFLPSKDELNLMFQNLRKNGLGNFSGGYCGKYFSSSSESGRINFYTQVFGDSCGSTSFGGFQTDNIRQGSNQNIRAIRAF